MYSRPNPRYSAADVLRHVPDPDAFIAEFAEERRRHDEARDRFIESLTPDDKAEWIGGEAVYHSPARDAHNGAVHNLVTLLGAFVAADDTHYVRSEKALMRVLPDRYGPDVAVWSKAIHTFAGEMLIYPPSELVVEVLSESTEKLDRGKKFTMYAAAGIPEYWIVDADKQSLEQYRNDGGVYAPEAVLRVGDRLSSLSIEGFEIPVAAVFEQSAFAKTLRALASA